MRCDRKGCKGLLQERGYGDGKYMTCLICGNLIFNSKGIQTNYEEARKSQCKNTGAAA